VFSIEVEVSDALSDLLRE